MSKNLIDDLLQHFKSTKGLYKGIKGRTEFVDLIFPYFQEYANINTPLSRPEYYVQCIDNDFRSNSRCLSYILNENEQCDLLSMSWKEVRIKAISEFIESCDRENALTDLKETLLSLLEKTDIHEKKLAVKLQGEILKLRGFKTANIGLLNENENVRWTNCLYYYFYFAVTDKLHSDMAFSLYPELEADLEEYNSKITLMYGVTGTPGMYQLYAMANRKNPNILALYECGELEYYGKGPSGKINYNNA